MSKIGSHASERESSEGVRRLLLGCCCVREGEGDGLGPIGLGLAWVSIFWFKTFLFFLF